MYFLFLFLFFVTGFQRISKLSKEKTESNLCQQKSKRNMNRKHLKSIVETDLSILFSYNLHRFFVPKKNLHRFWVCGKWLLCKKKVCGKWLFPCSWLCQWLQNSTLLEQSFKYFMKAKNFFFFFFLFK